MKLEDMDLSKVSEPGKLLWTVMVKDLRESVFPTISKVLETKSDPEKPATCKQIREILEQSKTEEEMIKVRNLGRKSLEEVVHKLTMMGLSLASEDNQ